MTCRRKGLGRQRPLRQAVDKLEFSVYIIAMVCHTRNPEGTGLVGYRNFGRIGVKQPAEPGPAALVRSLDPVTCCSLTVVCVDVASTVRAAGGWLFDRARAGWRVTAWAPAGSDVTPLRILGVETTFFFEAELEPSLFTPMPASLAVAAELLTSSSPLNARAQALSRRGMEVVVWGDEAFTSGQTFEQARHRLSAAASAFKARALRSASSVATEDSAELFRTCGSWYAIEHGVDLERV